MGNTLFDPSPYSTKGGRLVRGGRPIGIVGRFLGSAISNAASFAAGVAIGPVLAPPVQELRNQINAKYSFVYPDAGELASAVAEGHIPEAKGKLWASYHGIGSDAWSALLEAARTGPGVPVAFDLWRRGFIDEAGFRRAAKRQKLEQEWTDALVKAKTDLLSPGELAAAIHRGLVPDPGLLKGEQPSGPRNVEQYPVYPIDALEEAAGSGYDRERLGVLVGLQGLPMGTHEAAEALFRGILTHGDYIAAFNESNSRNEWAQAVLDYTRQIPTARDFIENALRGYRSFDQAADGAALHGMTREHAEVIFQNSGRAMNLHQITQALAYGANYNPAPEDDPDPYRQSTLVGPLRPEYYELNEALKYTLPSALYFRTLQQSGVLTQAQAERWYLRLGWPPELADQVSKAFAKQTSSAAKEATATDELALYAGKRIDRATVLERLQALGYDAEDAARKVDVVEARLVAGALSTALSGIHRKYAKGEATDEDVTQAAGELGLADWVTAGILARWRVERDTGGQAPTIGGVKADYKAGKLQRDDAIRTLELLGLTAQAAAVYLDT